MNKAELQGDKPCTQPRVVVFETQTGKSFTTAVGGVELKGRDLTVELKSEWKEGGRYFGSVINKRRQLMWEWANL